jgi:hypothetical protein
LAELFVDLKSKEKLPQRFVLAELSVDHLMNCTLLHVDESSGSFAETSDHIALVKRLARTQLEEVALGTDVADVAEMAVNAIAEGMEIRIFLGIRSGKMIAPGAND